MEPIFEEQRNNPVKPFDDAKKGDDYEYERYLRWKQRQKTK